MSTSSEKETISNVFFVAAPTDCPTGEMEHPPLKGVMEHPPPIEGGDGTPPIEGGGTWNPPPPIEGGLNWVPPCIPSWPLFVGTNQVMVLNQLSWVAVMHAGPVVHFFQLTAASGSVEQFSKMYVPICRPIKNIGNTIPKLSFSSFSWIRLDRCSSHSFKMFWILRSWRGGGSKFTGVAASSVHHCWARAPLRRLTTLVP
jgi:hypothetical protein